MEEREKRIYLIVGPTASGKTDYSIELALKLNSPIISSDSRQIYKELKIGTAPPSAEQMALVEHHFIHSHSIFNHYTAGKYELEALELIERLFKSYNSLVVVGGSGLYIKALIEGIDNFPPTDLQLREELTERLAREGIESLRRELKRWDPISYQEIDIANPQRVIRALEVTLATGSPFSSFKSSTKVARNFSYKRVDIEMERDKLYARIDKRVDLMMEKGLLEEVEALYPHRELPALKSVGYSELFDYIGGKHSLERAVELIKRNSRRYAKRQITWFKNQKF